MQMIYVNYPAVFLAAAAYMVIGMIWYGPLFGKQWQKLMGFTEDSVKNMKMTAKQAMTGGFVAALVMAYVLAHDAYVWGLFLGGSVDPYNFAYTLAFWIWLGYIATTQVGVVLWEGKSWKLFFLNASYSLLGLMAMACVITWMR